MNLLTTQSLPVPCYFVPLTPQYLPHHPILMVNENTAGAGLRAVSEMSAAVSFRTQFINYYYKPIFVLYSKLLDPENAFLIRKNAYWLRDTIIIITIIIITFIC